MKRAMTGSLFLGPQHNKACHWLWPRIEPAVIGGMKEFASTLFHPVSHPVLCTLPPSMVHDSDRKQEYHTFFLKHHSNSFQRKCMLKVFAVLLSSSSKNFVSPTLQAEGIPIFCADDPKFLVLFQYFVF